MGPVSHRAICEYLHRNSEVCKTVLACLLGAQVNTLQKNDGPSVIGLKRF